MGWPAAEKAAPHSAPRVCMPPQTTNQDTTTNNITTMPKLKRTSENQITKDTYDRGEEDSRFADEPDPGVGMKRASDDILKGRRILKVSR